MAATTHKTRSSPDLPMRIDVFFDVYPHPAKPYFEAQLTEWHRQGHQLRLFSNGRIPGATSEFPITFVHTLRERPVRLLARILWRAVTHPARSWRIAHGGRRPLQIVKLLATDAQLPTRAPDVHFVHNLATAVRFSYLRYAAPHTTLAIYYHGGEIPGVRQIQLTESAEALGRAHIVFSNTRASVAEAITRGAPADRTVAIPVGFPLERFVVPADRCHLPENHWRFVCVGRMAPEKGFDIALHAFSALRNHTASFSVTFIGGGPELDNLRQLAERLRIGEFIRFLGHVPFNKLIPLLAKFDVLIHCSRTISGSNCSETQATVLQEAMLMRTIIVASDLGGVRESLPVALHQYLYSPGSAPELLRRLVAVTTHNSDSLCTLGETARQFVLQRYDIRKVNSEILNMLTRITTENRTVT